jgi:hypothetical protein
MIKPFNARLLPAAKNGGFYMNGCRVWCGPPAEGEDGRFHLFASRWPTTGPAASAT